VSDKSRVLVLTGPDAKSPQEFPASDDREPVLVRSLADAAARLRADHFTGLLRLR
jgi:hypothetical protein